MSKCLGRCQGNSDQKQRSSQAQGEVWTERGEVGGKVMEDRRLRAQGPGEASAVGGRVKAQRRNGKGVTACVYGAFALTLPSVGGGCRDHSRFEKKTHVCHVCVHIM